LIQDPVKFLGCGEIQAPVFSPTPVCVKVDQLKRQIAKAKHFLNPWLIEILPGGSVIKVGAQRRLFAAMTTLKMSAAASY
jgi:hypothetical protein